MTGMSTIFTSSSVILCNGTVLGSNTETPKTWTLVRETMSWQALQTTGEMPKSCEGSVAVFDEQEDRFAHHLQASLGRKTQYKVSTKEV